MSGGLEKKLKVGLLTLELVFANIDCCRRICEIGGEIEYHDGGGTMKCNYVKVQRKRKGRFELVPADRHEFYTRVL